METIEFKFPPTPPDWPFAHPAYYRIYTMFESTDFRVLRAWIEQWRRPQSLNVMSQDDLILEIVIHHMLGRARAALIPNCETMTCFELITALQSMPVSSITASMPRPQYRLAIAPPPSLITVQLPTASRAPSGASWLALADDSFAPWESPNNSRMSSASSMTSRWAVASEPHTASVSSRRTPSATAATSRRTGTADSRIGLARSRLTSSVVPLPPIAGASRPVWPRPPSSHHTPSARSRPTRPVGLLPPFAGASRSVSRAASTTTLRSRSPTPPRIRQSHLDYYSEPLVQACNDLTNAVYLNQIDRVETYLRRHIPLGHSLTIACDQVNFDMVRLLVENGANVNSENRGRPLLKLIQGASTPEADATRQTRTDIVTYLLQNHASANIYEDRNWSVLFLAVIYNLADIVTQLMIHGANPRHASPDTTMTPIHAAACDSTLAPSILTDLLSKPWDGAIDIQNARGATALHLAAQRSNFQAVTVLIEAGADTTKLTTNTGATALIDACRVGMRHIGILRVLLSRSQAAVNIPDALGATPLSIAIATDHQELVTLLLSKGADPNQACRTYMGLDYPLPLAISAKSLDIVKALIAAGANVALTYTVTVSWPVMTRTTQTPLHEACQINDLNLEIIQTLVEAGAPINAQTSNGMTPLMYAVMRRDTQHTITVIDYLLAHGADKNMMNQYNQTAYIIAVHYSNTLVAARLLESPL